MSATFDFLLLGDPVEHSLSPQIYRAALAELGLRGTYEARQADEAAVDVAVQELRGGRIRGMNITMPLKSYAARASDVLTEEAKRSMSVNTLRFRNERVEGHSTDVAAATEVLGREGFSGDNPILLLGAGGAAAAVAVAVAVQKRRVYISARDSTKGAELITRSEDAAFIPFATPVLGAVVVNATPLGMNGESLPDGIVEACSGLVDLAYGATETPAVSKARDLGLPTVDGVEFLVMQAAWSFQWWTGEVAPVSVMVDAARKN